MNVVLSDEERLLILSKLSTAQREFLEQIRVSRRSRIIESLAKKRGSGVDSTKTLEQWDFVGYDDSGFGNRHFKCDHCGMSLRYRFTVVSLTSGEKTHIGRDCLESFYGIPSSVAEAIYRGNHSIHLDLDELLYKFENGWNLEDEHIKIPDGFRLDPSIERHLNLGLR